MNAARIISPSSSIDIRRANHRISLGRTKPRPKSLDNAVIFSTLLGAPPSLVGRRERRYCLACRYNRASSAVSSRARTLR